MCRIARKNFNFFFPVHFLFQIRKKQIMLSERKRGLHFLLPDFLCCHVSYACLWTVIMTWARRLILCSVLHRGILLFSPWGREVTRNPNMLQKCIGCKVEIYEKELSKSTTALVITSSLCQRRKKFWILCMCFFSYRNNHSSINVQLSWRCFCDFLPQWMFEVLSKHLDI